MKTAGISQKSFSLRDTILVPVLLIFFSPFIVILVIFLQCYTEITSFFNYFLIKFFKCGRFSKELSSAHCAKVPELFASICNQDTVSGTVTVSSGHRLDCGCSERSDGEQNFSVDRAQEHLAHIVSLRQDFRYSDFKFENYTFKTKKGLCTITYPVHKYAVFQEHGSAGYSIKSNAFTLSYFGSKSEFETLVDAAKESAKKGGWHEEIS